MKLRILIILFLLLSYFYSYSQVVRFSPEIMLGNRSMSYQHFIQYDLSNSWSVNNVTLFDSEYDTENNDLFFIRNMFSYSLNKSFKTNIAFGIKNPGSFITTTAQYVLNTPQFKISYQLGTTFQKAFTLEQSLNLFFSKRLTKSTELFMSGFAVFNTNFRYLNRGIQQFRIGTIRKGFQISLAINFDQFKKAKKTLENYGISLKYNF